MDAVEIVSLTSSILLKTHYESFSHFCEAIGGLHPSLAQLICPIVVVSHALAQILSPTTQLTCYDGETHSCQPSATVKE